MDSIKIVGGHRLDGTISISGAKNAALPLMVSSLLTEEPLTLNNVPDLADVSLLTRILSGLGVEITMHDQNGQGDVGSQVYTLHSSHITSTVAPYELVSRMRASFWVIGPLLARCGEARVSLPGGCAIGMRPVDLYLMGLRALGVHISIEKGYIVAKAPRGLIGAHIVFPCVTVGATHTLLMAATLARGETVIENAAREPEVGDLITCLNEMGARISGIGSSRLVIQGVDRLHGATHEVLPDRVEAGTYALATVAASGNVLLRNARPELMETVFDTMRQAGAQVNIVDEGVRIQHDGSLLRPVNVHTHPFPGFPTDLQAQLMALMTLSGGTSRICETIFENRFMHVNELLRLGANISLNGKMATVYGATHLKGTEVKATDLRASACLVIAGLAAEGITTISHVYHLDRGFERIEEKLSSVGADIKRCRG
ncbi:MAG: UDP-N-acetylglucosamine 1-carboxyvinyltransferase [Alphaproteobacteria bacterium]|nr:UDP-N-acetylglucosamine 1-carboxyvinyltransferase [Alphaproteobacteria bacterium]